jgi:2-polyprenyl-3-methyl-5-hydroxy-6-metoxy-1,4-benzoquinol methylase
MAYDTKIDFTSRNAVTVFIQLINDNSVVLEFGPASGRLTRYLKEVKSCIVYIVEIDECAATVASQYAEDFVVGDIQKYEWVQKFSSIKFDYILFADVLEHLLDPEPVLEKAKEFLKESGKIIISLPNISYNGVIIELIKNNYDVSDTGIFDKTHLHFWSMKSAENLFRKLGFGIELRDATYNQLLFSEFEHKYNSLPLMLENFLKSRKYGEVYQLIYVITKIEDVEMQDNIKNNSEYFWVQFFFDEGNGYDAYDSKKVFIDGLQNISNEIVDIPSSAKSFRLDPLNAKCVVKVNTLDYFGNEIPIAFTNGIRDGNFFYFNNDDPQIEYLINSDMKSISYSIEYFNIYDDFVYKCICDVLSNNQIILEQKDNYISEQGANIRDKEFQINELNKIISDKDLQINELNNIISDKEMQFSEQKSTNYMPKNIFDNISKKIRDIRRKD